MREDGDGQENKTWRKEIAADDRERTALNAFMSEDGEGQKTEHEEKK
jgi:hypothetical protein